ncbi:phage protein [Streptococcus canis]|nr:phage protein [Streptococcus canis]
MSKFDDFKFSEDWESNYFEVQALLGQEIDKLQNRVVQLANENRRLNAENWQLRHRKRK